MVLSLRLRWLVGVAAAVGLLLGFAKGDSAGLRGGFGNLSAPWLLIGLAAGFAAATLRRSAAAGLLVTVTALLGFYVALTVVLGGHLGGGGFPHELAKEFGANRIWFPFAVVSGPLMGVLGGLLRRRPGGVPVAVGALLAMEVLVVAAVRGHQLLPRPIGFSWGVSDWRPYLIECALGVALLAGGLLKRADR